MPCNHKFQNDLYLQRIDYEPNTLIVGTFNPEWPERNYAEWFYGRTQNNYFWCVLPTLYEGPDASLINAGSNEWRSFCRRHRIAITDLVNAIEDANEDNPDHLSGLGNYTDDYISNTFQNLNFVDIVAILQQHPTIRHVYLTRSATGIWNNCWRPVVQYAAQNGISSSVLLTPSGNARFQHGRYNAMHPDNPVNNLCDFILMRWQGVWHF